MDNKVVLGERERDEREMERERVETDGGNGEVGRGGEDRGVYEPEGLNGCGGVFRGTWVCEAVGIPHPPPTCIIP